MLEALVLAKLYVLMPLVEKGWYPSSSTVVCLICVILVKDNDNLPWYNQQIWNNSEYVIVIMFLLLGKLVINWQPNFHWPFMRKKGLERKHTRTHINHIRIQRVYVVRQYAYVHEAWFGLLLYYWEILSTMV